MTQGEVPGETKASRKKNLPKPCSKGRTADQINTCDHVTYTETSVSVCSMCACRYLQKPTYIHGTCSLLRENEPVGL